VLIYNLRGGESWEFQELMNKIHSLFETEQRAVTLARLRKARLEMLVSNLRELADDIEKKKLVLNPSRNGRYFLEVCCILCCVCLYIRVSCLSACFQLCVLACVHVSSWVVSCVCVCVCICICVFRFSLSLSRLYLLGLEFFFFFFFFFFFVCVFFCVCFFCFSSLSLLRFTCTTMQPFLLCVCLSVCVCLCLCVCLYEETSCWTKTRPFCFRLNPSKIWMNSTHNDAECVNWPANTASLSR
jgi:hypothetical protein